MTRFLYISAAAILLPAATFAASLSLAEAAKQEDKAAVRSLLAEKADVNAPLSDGTTALHWAAETDDADTVDLLLQAGANPKVQDRYGLTPLYFASANGNAAIIRRLLKAGADPNAPGAGGETILMAAVRAGNLDAVKALLQNGASVKTTDTATQQTALMLSVRMNQPETVGLLIEYGSQVNAQTRKGKTPAWRPPNAGGGSHGLGITRGGWPDRGIQEATPGAMTALLYAARDGRPEIVRSLVDAKADVNQVEANGIAPLLMAITNDHVEVARLLLDRGADAKAADWWGRTPLFAAEEIRDRDYVYGKNYEQGIDRASWLEFIKVLVARGVDMNARTKEYPPIRRWVMPINDISWVDFTGQTTFLRAALGGDVTVMRLLLEHGADPNIATSGGTTALMAASGVNWAVGQTFTEGPEHLLEAVKICLDHGADVNAANSMGITSVIGAANRGSNDILELLVSKGAKLDVKDNEGRTPLVWAKGVFLATVPPEEKPTTMALIQKLTGGQAQ
ncbi:MAG TPA: ankyrin repeat domain-containing protein [Bryobacteraceae bacterium]|nr:ankyrin repeat domain-containing protein [Bryobacteraceae bacterium]